MSLNDPPVRFLPLAVLPAVLLLLVGAPLMAQAEADDKGPMAAVSEPVHDFGTLERGDRVVHEFVVRNGGDAMLELFDARSSCGCTVIDFDRRIAPRESGVVRVAVETEQQAGAFAVSVGLLTNDVENPRINLTLKADLADRVRVEPGYVRYVTHQGFSERLVSKQRIYAADGNPLNVLSATSPYPFVETRLRAAVDDERLASGPAEQWILEVALLPGAPLGTMNDEVVVEIDHPYRSSLRLPVFGAVQAVLVAVPEVLDFGEVHREDGVRGSFRVDNTSPEEIQLIRVDSNLPGLRVEIDPEAGEPGAHWYINLEIETDMPLGLVEGVVRVHSTSELQPVIEVPIRGSVR